MAPPRYAGITSSPESDGHNSMSLVSSVACAKSSDFGICVWLGALFGTRIRNDPQFAPTSDSVQPMISMQGFRPTYPNDFKSFIIFKSNHTNNTMTMTNSISNTIQFKKNMEQHGNIFQWTNHWTCQKTHEKKSIHPFLQTAHRWTSSVGRWSPTLWPFGPDFDHPNSAGKAHDFPGFFHSFMMIYDSAPCFFW